MASVLAYVTPILGVKTRIIEEKVKKAHGGVVGRVEKYINSGLCVLEQQVCILSITESVGALQK